MSTLMFVKCFDERFRGVYIICHGFPRATCLMQSNLSAFKYERQVIPQCFDRTKCVVYVYVISGPYFEDSSLYCKSFLTKREKTKT